MIALRFRPQLTPLDVTRIRRTLSGGPWQYVNYDFTFILILYSRITNFMSKNYCTAAQL